MAWTNQVLILRLCLLRVLIVNSTLFVLRIVFFVFVQMLSFMVYRS